MNVAVSCEVVLPRKGLSTLSTDMSFLLLRWLRCWFIDRYLVLLSHLVVGLCCHMEGHQGTGREGGH